VRSRQSSGRRRRELRPKWKPRGPKRLAAWRRRWRRLCARHLPSRHKETVTGPRFTPTRRGSKETFRMKREQRGALKKAQPPPILRGSISLILSPDTLGERNAQKQTVGTSTQAVVLASLTALTQKFPAQNGRSEIDGKVGRQFEPSVPRQVPSSSVPCFPCTCSCIAA
jgi:hypothetical protein